MCYTYEDTNIKALKTSFHCKENIALGKTGSGKSTISLISL
jgi:ABC-type transport system involved in cytochrome bd biosynthesis fused ATPase/permease subunit